ncbi:MAG: glycoside hydrolase domain-containing protein [Thermoguttaceae bacterium]|jgi:hypothetical protein
MARWLSRLAVCWLFWWTAAGTRAADPLSSLPLPEMVVTRLRVPPKIDGLIGPGQWDAAAACTAFMPAFKNELSPIQSVARMGYDDKYLYVAIKNYRGPGDGFLKKTGREPDDEAIVFDAASEIWITPPGTPVTTYQTLLNTYPAVLDVKMIPSVGYTGKSWNGKWEIAAGESKEAWSIEARAPIASFGRDAIHDGDRWRGLFCTDMLGGAGFTAWAPGGGFADTTRHGYLQFRDNSPAFQLLDVETIFTGKFDFPMAVVGPAKGRSTVEVGLRFGRGIRPAPADIVLRKTVSVAEGKREAFRMKGDLGGLDLSGQGKPPRGYCEVTAAEGRSVLYHQVFPFVLDGFRRTPPATIITTPYKTPFGLTANYAPLAKKLIVKVDRFYLPNRAEVAGGTARLVDRRSGSVAAQRPLAPFYYDYSQFAIDLAHLSVPIETEAAWQQCRPALAANEEIEKRNAERAKRGQPPLPLQELPLKPAQYTLEVTLTDEQGRKLCQTAEPVALKGYQFEWLPNSIGISDRAIPPWTPVRVQAGTVEMWNKRYRLDGLGLAREITNAGAPQLRGPMRLVALIDGRETALAASEPKLVRSTAAYAELEGSARAAGLQVQVDTRVEFDGCVLNTMRLSPQAAVNLDRLSLVVTMPKAEAPCFVTTAGGWSSTFGWTPRRWDSRETSTGALRGNFVPFVLLTDSDRGFCWFADNEQGWILDPRQPTLELDSNEQTVTFRANFVTRPGLVERPTTLRYGWIVTPQKPQPAGWRTWKADFHRPFPELHSVFWGMDQINWAVLWPYYSSPYPWDYEKSKPAYDAARKSGVVLGAGNIAHAIARYRDYKGRWFNELAADWGQALGDLGNGNVALSRGPNDFRLWHWDRWIRLSGLNGLYFDETYLAEDRNYLSGGAYLLPDERIQPGYSFLGERELSKRLRYLFHEHGLEGPRIWFHTTANHPVYAWMPDISMEGENVEPTGGDNDYMEALPASRLRSIGMGRNLGTVPLVMTQAERHWDQNHSPLLVPQMVGWVMAHDCLPENSGFCDVLRVEHQMWRDEIVFRPYWKAGQGITVDGSDVVVSAHTWPRHALLWICNTARAERQARLELDLPALGFEPGDRAHPVLCFDAETGERYPLSSDNPRAARLSIPVPPRFWRAVRLVQPQLLRPGQTFLARFRSGDGKADESLGYGTPVDRAPPEAALPAGQKGIVLDRPLVYLARHHVLPDRGAIAFQVQLDPRTAEGTLVRVDRLRIALRAGAIQVGTEKESFATAELKLPPGRAWHAVRLQWRGPQLTLRIDDRALPAVTLPGGMPLKPPGRGLAIRGAGPTQAEVATVAFGPITSAVLAELVMERE